MKVIIILLIFIIIFLNLISTELIENTEHMDNVTTIQPDTKASEYFQEVNSDNKIQINFENEFKKKIDINEPYAVSFLFRLNNIADYISEYPIILYSVNYLNEENEDDKKGFILYLQTESKDSKEPADLKLVFYDNDTILKSFTVSKYSFSIDSKETTTVTTKSPQEMNNIDYITKFSEEEDFNNIYYHFAVSQNNNSIDVFLDGFRSSIMYPKLLLDNNLKLKESYIGDPPEQVKKILENPELSLNSDRKKIIVKDFNGSIPLKYIDLFKSYKTSGELCNIWKSCGFTSCNYYEGGNQTQSRDECYKDCLKVSNCSTNECYNKCYNIKISNWSECNFKAYGKTPQDCIKICSTTNNSCNYADCQYLCNKCKDPNICYWNQEFKIKPSIKNLLVNTVPPSNYNNKKPMFPRIIVRPQKKKGHVRILFTTPNILDKDGNYIPIKNWNGEKPKNVVDEYYKDNRITAFIYILYKHTEQLNKEKDIKIGIWNAKYNDVNITDLNSVQYIYKEDLKDLDPNSIYTIYIRSYRPSMVKINGEQKRPNTEIDKDVIESITDQELYKLDTETGDSEKMSIPSNIVKFRPTRVSVNLENNSSKINESLSKYYKFHITGEENNVKDKEAESVEVPLTSKKD